MKKRLKRMVTGAASTAMLVVSAAAPFAAEAESVVVTEREETACMPVANVHGTFFFDQDVVTPTDEVFNLFGTAITGMCAKPDFAFDHAEQEHYYINFGGALQKVYTLDVKDIKETRCENRTLKCSCATGAAIANVEVTGIPLENIMQMIDVAPEANNITLRAADGYSVKMPLRYALDRHVMFVYQVGETPVPTGVQVWVPKSVARYFVRNVVDVEFTVDEAEADVITPDEQQRAKISILNMVHEDSIKVGDQIAFEGYADDFDQSIAAIEFSMDNGETWTSYETAQADAERWVYWHFGYTVEASGTYKLDVRARTASGKISPLAASTVFTVK